MGELGNLLRTTREEKKITFDDVQEATMIQSRMLKALEEENYSYFAGEVYVKGAIRNYARYLGLDPEEVLKLYVTPEVTSSPQPSPPPIKKNNRKKRKRPAVLIIILVLIAAAAVYYFLVEWGNTQNNDNLPNQNQDNPLEQEDENPEESTAGGNEEEGNSSDNNNSQPSEELNNDENKETPDLPDIRLTGTDDGDLFYTVSGAENIEMLFEFTGSCWIRLNADGNNIMEKSFSSGQELTQSAEEELKFRLGNPLGVEVTVNGVILDEISGREDAINVTVTIEE